ncbi:sulfite exporter TauE/SafE family protein [Methylocystis sp. FS]|uniref:cytochrome c biogenesis CcdA family protein n=1 Tax=Methylocystis silviterrae TaxID=2743612 RepID=UPI001581B2D1|nr:cytochrome c biogenesis protein CcdA [Methylocystis silviterrae]NUJ81323.1 sulfite exporter TauE/SafE family protein [Methylocystis silviterrae]
MDAEALRQAVSHGGFAALWVGLAAGFAFSFNPVALAAIPVSLAYVTKARSKRQAALFGGLFVLGMILTHVGLGLLASLGGSWVQYLLDRAWGLALGPLLIVMGFIWLGWLRIPAPALAVRAKRATGAWGAFVLGIPFSVAVCPFCTPALIVLLGVALGVGSPLFGATLLLAFALGRAIPIMLGALAVSWLENLSRLRPFYKAIELIGGIVLILTGLYMLNAYFVVVPGLAA